MRRFDRAVLFETVPIALICVVGLTFLFTAISLYQIINRLEAAPGAATLMSFAPTLWVSLLPMTLPISVLLAVALAYGRMRFDRELLLMSATGLPPWRAFLPVVWVGAASAVLAFGAASEVGPAAYGRRHQLLREALADFIERPSPGARELRFPGLDLSYADARNSRFENLSVVLYDDRGLVASLTAHQASLTYDRAARELVLSNCVKPRVVTYDPVSGKPIGTVLSAERITNFRRAFDFRSDEEAQSNKAWNTAMLLSRLGDAGDAHGRAEFVRRLGLGLAGLLLPLLGALMAALVNHPNRLFAVAVGAIPGAILYYPLLSLASGLTTSKTLGIEALALPVGASLVAITVLLVRYSRGART
ncbi:MAG: LptF/LptG family permease [Planctomycetes bacterium]|nr:LptF/LptG family permease [Planctomycetota bacterium]